MYLRRGAHVVGEGYREAIYASPRPFSLGVIGDVADVADVDDDDADDDKNDK